jgi:predicted outer membrane lipoprotein
MTERVQFFGVLLWMIGMLVMAAFAVRAVWLEAGQEAEPTGSDGHATNRTPSTAGGADKPAAMGSESAQTSARPR